MCVKIAVAFVVKCCDDSIKKIIIGGLRAYDYKVRLLLAGVNPNKIFIEDREEDTYRQLTFENIDKIVIVHDIYMVSTCEKIVSKIKEVFEWKLKYYMVS